MKVNNIISHSQPSRDLSLCWAVVGISTKTYENAIVAVVYWTKWVVPSGLSKIPNIVALSVQTRLQSVKCWPRAAVDSPEGSVSSAFKSRRCSSLNSERWMWLARLTHQISHRVCWWLYIRLHHHFLMALFFYFFLLPILLQQEYVLQADGSITPLSSMQNFVLSEKQAGEILAQVPAASEPLLKITGFHFSSVFFVNFSTCTRHTSDSKLCFSLCHGKDKATHLWRRLKKTVKCTSRTSKDRHDPTLSPLEIKCTVNHWGI